MDLKAVILLDKRDSLAGNIKILGRSFIELQLESMINAGIKEVHVLAAKNYLHQKDKTNFYFHQYNSEEGLISYIRRLNLDAPLLLINDNSMFTDTDIENFISDFISRRLTMSALVSEREVDNYYFPQIENKLVKKISTDYKGKSFSGYFLMSRDVLEIAENNKMNLFYEELIGWLLRNNRIINTFMAQDHFMQIDTLDSWKQENFSSLKTPLFEINTPKIKDSYIGADSEIDFSSFIEGVSFVGSKVVVGKNSLIKDSVIQSLAVIGNDCQIINSIIGENVHIGNNCLIENATIANNCQLMGNSRLRNMKLGINSIVTKYTETE